MIWAEPGRDDKTTTGIALNAEEAATVRLPPSQAVDDSIEVSASLP
jgi:hypothetical protein